LASRDLSRPWVRLLRIILFAFVALLLAWPSLMLVDCVICWKREFRCRHNLMQIAGAIGVYQSDYGNQFPPYLKALYPKYLNKPDVFVCDADRADTEIGAQPRWMEEHGALDDCYRIYRAIDLDGPTGDAAEDEDTFPCSYLYALNVYEEEAFDGFVWRGVVYAKHKSTGLRRAELPILRCLHHLPPEPLPERDSLDELIPCRKTNGSPTLNIMYDLSFRRLPEEWSGE